MRCAPGWTRTGWPRKRHGSDVSTALSANNYLTAVGRAKGQAVSVDLTASTDLHSLEEFKHLVVKAAEQRDRAALGAVGDRVLGAEITISGAFNGNVRAVTHHRGGACSAA